MDETKTRLATNAADPWLEGSFGLLAMGIVTLLLIGFTIWTYIGHPTATRRRVFIVLALRIAALIVALLTTYRPYLRVEEKPNNPSVLLIGVDVSETMSVKDEVNNQARIDAVRKVMEKCQPTIDELTNEHNVNVVLYKFSTPDFSEGVNRYSLADPADGKRSDYGAYLNRTFERWQTERFFRGHLIVGDGQANGETYSAIAEAAKWGRAGKTITTFTVGQDSSEPQAQDIVVTGIEANPSPAWIKTEVTVTGTVHAFGFVGSRVLARLYVNGKVERTEEVTLEKERDNKVKVTFKAPAEKGEYKLKLAIGQEKPGDNPTAELVPLRGERSGENNASETYLTVNKDGVRILVIDRLRWEETRLRDVLRTEKRFDVNEVIRQTDGQISPAVEELLDLDAQAYDVIIVGNVSPSQLVFRRGEKTISVLDKIRDRVVKNGTGVIFLGGEHAFRGVPENLLPVEVPLDPKQAIVEDVDPDTKEPRSYYQTVPNDEGLSKMFKLSRDRKESIALWDELNTFKKYSRLTGYNKMKPRGGATVYAWATPTITNVPLPPLDAQLAANGADPLMVGWQIGDGNRGRVLAFAAFDTYLWEKLGQPKTRQGSEIHSRFWKQTVLWLAHQEEDESAAYANPTHKQMKVGGEQVVRVGVKLPNGNDDPNAELFVKILPMPEGKPEPAAADIEKAKLETVIRDPKGAKVLFRPSVKGEYFVVLTSPKKDATGKPVLDAEGKPILLRATAKFIAIPDISDEMLKVNADHDFMRKLSEPNGGKALRLEDLPSYLKDMKDQKPESLGRPVVKSYPDWRRNHSGGFLTLWFVIFTLLIGTEWGLRRLWGMV